MQCGGKTSIARRPFCSRGRQLMLTRRMPHRAPRSRGAHAPWPKEVRGGANLPCGSARAIALAQRRSRPARCSRELAQHPPQPATCPSHAGSRGETSPSPKRDRPVQSLATAILTTAWRVLRAVGATPVDRRGCFCILLQQPSLARVRQHRPLCRTIFNGMRKARRRVHTRDARALSAVPGVIRPSVGITRRGGRRRPSQPRPGRSPAGR
jgi:hypothetical protein